MKNLLRRIVIIFVLSLFVGSLLVRAKIPQQIGYYDIFYESSRSYLAAPITAAGHNPVEVTQLDANNLNKLDVLFVTNRAGFYRENALGYRDTLANAVYNGMTLVLHDRHVKAAAEMLPGGGEVTVIAPEYGVEIDIVENRTPITRGPGGGITDDTLDGGRYSTHGYILRDTLPQDAMPILATNNPDQIVTFAYPYGSGYVIYSTIPVDYYLADPLFKPEFSQTYAVNAVASAASIQDWFSLNDTPVAQPQQLEVDKNTSVPITLTGTDRENDDLVFSIVAGPQYGSLSGEASNLVYTPNRDYTGTDQFSFTVSDGTTISEAAVINLTISEPISGVMQFELWDSTTNTHIRDLNEETIINLDETPSVSLVVTHAPPATQSFQFTINGEDSQTENFAPYTIVGDRDGRLTRWNITVGKTYEITATAYSEANASGAALRTDAITVRVVNMLLARESGFYLWDAESDTIIRRLNTVETLDLSVLPAFSIDAMFDQMPDQIEFYLNGQYIRTENYIPYTINGDNPDTGDLDPWLITPGTYHIEARPAIGKPLTMQLTVVTRELAKAKESLSWFGQLQLRSICRGLWEITNPSTQDITLQWIAYDDLGVVAQGTITAAHSHTVSLPTPLRVRGVLLNIDGESGHLYTEASGVDC